MAKLDVLKFYLAPLILRLGFLFFIFDDFEPQCSDKIVLIKNEAGNDRDFYTPTLRHTHRHTQPHTHTHTHTPPYRQKHSHIHPCISLSPKSFRVFLYDNYLNR